MRFLLLFFLSPFLSGCGAPDDNNHGFGYAYDFIAEDSTRLRNTPALSFTKDEFNSLIADQYKQIEVCTKLSASGPLVILVEPEIINFTGGRTYFGNEPLILLSTAYAHDVRAVRHEYVHYLLDQSGMPEDQNAAHASPFFAQCAGF